MTTFTALSKKCEDMVTKLHWQTYHTPENLTSLLIGEVGEISEICVWLTKEQILTNLQLKEHVIEELGDVVKGTLFLFNSLHLPATIETLIAAKLDYENFIYPVSEFKGQSKYQKLTLHAQKDIVVPALPTKNIVAPITIDELEQRAWANAKSREWDKYYSPASLCLGIFEDCSKIYTSFQRRTTIIANSHERMVWAIAGILILSMRLHTYLELDDLGKIIITKLDADYKRFSK